MRCLRHPDRTPSLFIHPGKQLFRCHSCGWGGDVYRFVEDMEGVKFAEALSRLAARKGLELQGRTLTDEDRRQGTLDTELRQQLERAGFTEQDQRNLFRRYRGAWRTDPEFRAWLTDDLEDTRRSTSWIVARLSVMTETLAA
jgi:DNA primase